MMVKRILALETTTEACSVGLWIDGEIQSCYENCPRQHTQRILPMVQQLLAQAGITLQMLNALAFSRGPGSFTGVRIGVGVAQGLALGADLPLISVSTLLILAQGAYRLQGSQQVFVAMDARIGQLYWASYCHVKSSNWQLQDQEQLLTPQQSIALLQQQQGQWSYAGTAWQAYPALLAEHYCMQLTDTGLQLPQAQDMLPLAAAAFLRGELLTVEQAHPDYLRHQVAVKPAATSSHCSLHF